MMHGAPGKPIPSTAGPSSPGTPSARGIPRRGFLRRAAAASCAAFVGTLGYTALWEPFWFDFVRRTLPVRNLPRSWVGRTMVQLSDIHVGDVVSDDYLKAAFRQVNNLKPDLVVLTGDFVTWSGLAQLPQLAATFQALEPGRLGTLAVLGNHDYGGQFRSGWVAGEISKVVRDLGIDLLRNEVRHIEGLQILGMDDYRARRLDVRGTLAQHDPRRAAITLLHNPDSADVDGWGDYDGWILCGHTHGGQCRVPGLGSPYLPVHNRRYVAGEIPLLQGRRMYINRGLGYIYPLRFNARPEITVFTLTDGAAPSA